MITARSANNIAFLAIILTVAALVFPKNTGAASGNIQICQTNTSCTIGEFLYDDSYTPITDATCNITSRHPNGTFFKNNINLPASTEGDGWYAHSFIAPSTIGLYRTEIKCVTGGQTLALDKSFEVQSPPAAAATPPTANEVAASVWGYSGRSLSTFGNLVTDIWGSATRTLTGATLSSGSLATKNDVTTTITTNTTNVSNITNTTNNLLEQLVNKPILDHLIDVSDGTTTTELQTKLEKSEQLASQLLTSGTYLKSKTNLLKAGGKDIKQTTNQLKIVVDSMDEGINWITEEWDIPISLKLQSQNKKIALSLKNINSSVTSVTNLSSNIDYFLKLVGESGDSSKSNTLFGSLEAKKELLSLLDKNYTEADRLLTYISKDTNSQGELIIQINSLGKQIANINQLPKMNKTILSQASTKMDQKQLKNKTLSLRGIVGANKLYLAQKPDQPLRSLWFEEGSIVFKTLISNPSKLISQDVPLKYFLPKEVTKENIIKTDQGLTINYDVEKDLYYVSGNFTLTPGETKTVSVTADDSAFHIPDSEIATMRRQTEELSKPLNNTAYFAQGVTLKTDIDVSLDKIDSLQKNSNTPEAKIRGYRESQIELKAAKEKLERLKELATTAGSVGTLFGFVGGAQAIAVWGLIIIMVAGFVFLSLYMRTLKNSEKHAGLEQRGQLPFEDNFENYEEVPPTKEHTDADYPTQKFHFGKPIKYISILLVTVLLGGGGTFALLNLRPDKHEATQTTAQSVLGSSNTNIASQSAQLNLNSYTEINIVVPEESIVTMHPEPTINSPVLKVLNASRKAKEITRQDNWVKILLQESEGKNIEGWVDEDFVEEGGIQTNQRKVVINNTPTGFLRVRQSPGGKEITKIGPGEEYPAKGEEAGWVQITLEDGTPGWVSKQYVK